MRGWRAGRIRAVLGRRLELAVDIYEPVRGVDESGAAYVTMALAVSGVAARLIYPQKSNTSAVTDIEGAEVMRDEYRLIVPAGTGLGVDYEIALADGTRFKVVRIVDNLTGGADEQAVVTRRR